MGKWQVYEVILRAKSPLHFGDRKMGVVDLTKRWIPGKTLWGVCTAITAKSIMQKYNPAVYQIVGEILKQNVVFTPFYLYHPSSNHDISEGTTYIPFHGNGALEYICAQNGLKNVGTISEYELDLQHIDSYTSTAIQYSTSTAADNMLHELEYIRSGSFFRGYIACKSGVTLADDTRLMQLQVKKDMCANTLADLLQSDWKDYLGLQGLGGDRTRGFGNVDVLKVVLVKDPSRLFTNETTLTLSDNNPSKVKNWLWEWNDSVTVKLAGSSLALIPLLVKPPHGDKGIDLEQVSIEDFAGDMEPIIGREWDAAKGAGQSFSQMEVQICTGSTFSIHKELMLTVDGFGRCY